MHLGHAWLTILVFYYYLLVIMIVSLRPLFTVDANIAKYSKSHSVIIFIQCIFYLFIESYIYYSHFYFATVNDIIANINQNVTPTLQLYRRINDDFTK